MTVIDVSQFQGIPDFHELKKHGVVAVYIKATEGETFVSPAFHEQWAKAGEAGLIRGTYHFARQDQHPAQTGAIAEARHYIHAMRALPNRGGHGWHKGELRPVLDFEIGTPDKRYSSWRNEFFRIIHTESGHATVLYTFPGFNSWMTPPRFASQLWIAHFGVAKPQLPGGYGRYELWQYDDHGRLPGIHGDVDLSKLAPRKTIAAIRCRATG